MANITNANSAYVSSGNGNVYNLTNQTTYGTYTDAYGHTYPIRINYSGGTANFSFKGAYFSRTSIDVYTPFLNISNITIVVNGSDCSNIASAQTSYELYPNPQYIDVTSTNVFTFADVQCSFNYQSLVY